MSDELKAIEYHPAKVEIDASYDVSGCYSLSVRLNQDVIMREDILTAIEALFRAGFNREEMPAAPAPPAPPTIRPVPGTMPVTDMWVHRQPNAGGMTLTRRVPGEAATQIIPVWRDGDGGRKS